MTEKTNVISIDGTDYSESDLSDDAKSYITQLHNLGMKKANLKMDFEQLEAAESVFMSKLKESLPESESEESEAKVN